jgi:branched-subunit amino acid transport protein AzlD
MVATAVLGLALIVSVFVAYKSESAQSWLKRLSAIGSGFVLGCLVIFLLPSVYTMSASVAFFTVIGMLLVPLLHLLLVERQSENKKVRHPLAGLLSWARVALLALLYGDVVAMLGVQTWDIVLFSFIAFFALLPEIQGVYSLLHYEGAKKNRAAIIASFIGFLPILAALAVGTLVLVMMRDLAAPFVGLAVGTMLYMVIGDRIADSLRRQDWIEIALSMIGAAIAASIAVFL